MLGESGNLDWFTANLENRFTGVLLLAGATYLSLFALGALGQSETCRAAGIKSFGNRMKDSVMV